MCPLWYERRQAGCSQIIKCAAPGATGRRVALRLRESIARLKRSAICIQERSSFVEKAQREKRGRLSYL
jgi:hypothetical protein